MDAPEALLEAPRAAPSRVPAPLPAEPLEDLIFVDLETTGCNAAHHRIIEVGLVRVRHGMPVETWSSLVNPGVRIPQATTAFTGITDAMVAAAPTFEALAPELRARFAGDPAPVFVAHNARFDYAFLRAEFRRLDEVFRARVLCTVRLSRRLFPENPSHSLDALIERHGLACTARHRALGDAQVLADYFARLRAALPHEGLSAAVVELIASQRLPAHLPEGLEDELPEGPGAYRLYGEGGELLYVGRSRTLRTRILSHFGGAAAVAPRGLAAAVHGIDWEETAGELGAALKEAAWIERGKPQRKRRVKTTAGITLALAPSGGVEFREVATLEPHELAEAFGLFASEAEAHRALAEIARAHVLCLKQLGLELSAGSCFALQMGRCKGACVGREPEPLHALRVRMALAPLKLKPWPFAGRAALVERGVEGQCELHVVENWVYVGTARSEEELEALALEPAPRFDAHRYRILVRHLGQHRGLEWRDLERVRAP